MGVLRGIVGGILVGIALQATPTSLTWNRTTPEPLWADPLNWSPVTPGLYPGKLGGGEGIEAIFPLGGEVNVVVTEALNIGQMTFQDNYAIAVGSLLPDVAVNAIGFTTAGMALSGQVTFYVPVTIGAVDNYTIDYTTADAVLTFQNNFVIEQAAVQSIGASLQKVVIGNRGDLADTTWGGDTLTLEAEAGAEWLINESSALIPDAVIISGEGECGLLGVINTLGMVVSGTLVNAGEVDADTLLITGIYENSTVTNAREINCIGGTLVLPVFSYFNTSGKMDAASTFIIDRASTLVMASPEGNTLAGKSFKLLEAHEGLRVGAYQLIYPVSAEGFYWRIYYNDDENPTQLLIESVPLVSPPKTVNPEILAATSNRGRAAVHRLSAFEQVHIQRSSAEPLTLFVPEETGSTQVMPCADSFQQLTPVEELGERAVQPGGKPWSVYVTPTGTFGWVSPIDHPGSNYHSWGARVGTDRSWAREEDEKGVAWGIGASVHYTNSQSQVDLNLAHCHFQQLYGKLYSAVIPKQLEEFSLNLMLSGGYDWYHSWRKAGLTGNFTARSDTRGWEWDALVGVEYCLAKRQIPQFVNWKVILAGTVQYAWLMVDSYDEHDAGVYNLHYGTDVVSMLWSALEARVNSSWQVAEQISLQPEVGAGWQRRCAQTNNGVAFVSIESTFPSSGILPPAISGPNVLVAEASLKAVFYRDISLQLEYQVTYNDLILDNSFNLQWKWEF